MRNITSIFIFSLFSTFLLCQKQDYIWNIGVYNDETQLEGTRFNFNFSPFQLNKTNLPFGFDNNNTIICDENGEVLLYFNGCAISNNQNRIISNGNDINDDIWKEIFNWTNCDHGYPGIQNSAIIPDPGRNNGYYLFHKPFIYNNSEDPISLQLWFSYIDLELNGGKGEVIFKDSIVTHDRVLSSYLELVPHKNNSYWWLIQPLEEDSFFISYLIDSFGIQQYKKQSSYEFFTSTKSSSSGTLRISPDGNYLAFYNYYDNLIIYKFNRETGEISFSKKIILTKEPNINLSVFGSAEWSSNSRFIYVCTSDSLFQVDFKSESEDSIIFIDSYNGTLDPFPTDFYTMVLAPDCKIYMCSRNSTNSFHIINNPNEKGLSCNFKQNSLSLPNISGSGNLPILPRFRINSDSKCDSNIIMSNFDSHFNEINISIYPNPVIDFVSIKCNNKCNLKSIEIYDIMGKRVFKEVRNSRIQINNIDLSMLETGYYFIQMKHFQNSKYYTTIKSFIKI